jgi:ABC-type branched-subunit amino acid transport system permease subunit
MPTELVKWTQIIYGVILILILTLRPEGLINRRLIYRIGMFFRKEKC